MNIFDITAILLTLAAIFGYLNHRVLRLPQTIGILAIALVSSLVMVVIDALVPTFHLRDLFVGFLLEIDFNEALMHGMLCFLLFAGALHVDLNDLLGEKWTITVLASLSLLISTALIGLLAYALFGLFDLDVPLLVCLCFGALISPTDPIAVLGLLKELRAPKTLETKIAGESLFNDGIAVVVFVALVSLAGLQADEAHQLALDPLSIGLFFAQEFGGGVLLGLVFGYIVYRMLKTLDNHPLELLITIAAVMFCYSLSFWVRASGPIAVVVTGLFIGNHGKRFAMSETTAAHIDTFWSMSDELLNAILFLLLGLEVFALHPESSGLFASFLMVPIVLLGRFVSVSVPITGLRLISGYRRGLIPILTWGGLRGGISVALVLSLPKFPAKELLLSCTYAVVVFSVLVQGLSMRRLLKHYGLAAEPSAWR